MIIFVDYKQYIKCKYIFLVVSKQFINKPKNNLEFLQYHKNLVEKDPYLTDYMYQFALTACFEKYIYDSKELEKVFENTFKIKENYFMNGNECNISTLNNAFIINFMAKNTPFKKFFSRYIIVL